MRSGIRRAVFPAVLAFVAAPVFSQPSAERDSARTEGEGAPALVRPASTVLLPVVSIVIPGFGQLAQKRYVPGFAYASSATAGLILAAEAGSSSASMEDILFDRRGARNTFYGLGVLYQGAGFLSAWDVFQASVPALQQEQGRFRFLPRGKRETPIDLLKAPFDPGYLARPTTWVPLGLLGGLAALGAASYRADKDGPGVRWLPYTPGDAFFTGTLSMNAGATEEAFFRGYMQPLFHQWSGERAWISNPAQALLFGAAHLGDVSTPVAQTVFGWYAGWLNQRNGWRIGQAVALHFWWDVIAVTSTMFTRHEVPISLGSFEVPVDL